MLVLVKIEPGQSLYISLDQQQAFLVEPKSLTGLILLMQENRHLWILVDANASPDGVPDELRILGGPAPMFVYSSSPRYSRWALTNQSNTRLLTIFMNPWSKWEAELL